jgi:hypothetical protein
MAHRIGRTSQKAIGPGHSLPASTRPGQRTALGTRVPPSSIDSSPSRKCPAGPAADYRNTYPMII